MSNTIASFIRFKFLPMKKLLKSLFSIASGVLLVATAPVISRAQITLEAEQSAVLPITGTIESTDGTLNYKTFEITAPEDGLYYAGAWLLPSILADGGFTTFNVYANSVFVGSVTPTSDNWQYISLNDEPLRLSAGKNTIAVATQMPEFPSVETIKVSQDADCAIISSEAYDEYLEESSADYIDMEEECEYSEEREYSCEKAAEKAVTRTLDLRYTFYKTFTFAAGEELVITSSSNVAHNLDVFYHSFAIVQIGDYLTIPDSIESAFKVYSRPSSEEMQGLNWMAPGLASNSINRKVATVRMTVPKTGMYLVRVRNAINFGAALADLNVNGKYIYKNVPITYDGAKIDIPADGTCYAVTAIGSDPKTDDPMVFIHGNDADRVVGYNDNGYPTEIEQNGLCAWDSFLSQKYFVRATSISVSSQSSSVPVSKCTINVFASDNSVRSYPSRDTKVAPYDEEASAPFDSEGINVSKSARIGGDIMINSCETIERVTAYAISGNQLGSTRCSESMATIPVSALGVFHPGIYIICVETTNGIASKKINVLQ